MHVRGTLEPLKSQLRGPEGGVQAQGWPVKQQMDSQANRPPQITRYEDMARAAVGLWAQQLLPSIWSWGALI